MPSIKGPSDRPLPPPQATAPQAAPPQAAPAAAQGLSIDRLKGPERPKGFVAPAQVPGTSSASAQGVSPIALEISSRTQAEPTSLHFNKHTGPDISYPLTASQLDGLKDSNAVSPILVSDAQVHVAPDFLPKPTHPGDPGFWNEFDAIIDMQKARREGAPASDLLDVPKVFEGYTMEQGAQAVRADFPSKWPTALIEQFLSEGAKMDPEIVPQRSQDDFVRGPVLLSRTIGWAVSEVSPSAFACKWSEGRARPESVAWAVHTGELEAPAHIKEKIAQMNLTKPEDFTAYKEGCPNHPSWPAMHSAASSASLYMAVLMDLSPEQMAEAKRLDYSVATFRSAAGVHYDTDNRAGLALGQEVIAKQLPEYLEQFGADPDKVRAKIDRLRHDWFEYDGKSR